MTKPEKILGIIIAISLILKFNFLPYGGILLLLSLSGLAFYYFQFGKAVFNEIDLKSSLRKGVYKKIQNSLLIISNAAGIGLSLICIGVLFKLNQWGYSNIILVFGLSTTFLISIVVLTSWRKSDKKTYKSILKRTVTIGIIGLIVAMTPYSDAYPKENPYQTEKVNNWIFQYKLMEGKLVDTLKILDPDKNLVLLQKWENGKLKKTFDVDEYGKIRELAFFSHQDSNTITQYYYDINDRNYETYAYSDDMFDFYEKHSFLSLNSIFHDTINEIDLFNYPQKHLMIAITKGKITLGKDNFIIEPNAPKGDTMKVFLLNPLKRTFTREFNLIIK